METLTKVFKALSDETRLKILMIISSRTICQKGISRQLEISDSAVSQHIKILKEAGILTGYKEGYFVFYQVNNQVFKDCISFMQFLGDDIDVAPLEMDKILNIKGCSGTCKGSKKCCKSVEE